MREFLAEGLLLLNRIYTSSWCIHNNRTIKKFYSKLGTEAMLKSIRKDLYSVFELENKQGNFGKLIFSASTSEQSVLFDKQKLILCAVSVVRLLYN